MKKLILMFTFSLIVSASCPAQQSDSLPASKPWQFTATANTYIFNDASVYINPIFRANRKHLHLQARYNYEDLRTGSVFGGYNFSVGKKVEFSATPMLGVVFGNSNGIAPGLMAELNWRFVNFSVESEYFFELDKESSFYYAWVELTAAPADWMWLGLVAQRTRLYKTDLEVQGGLIIGFTEGFLSVATYVFNIGFDDPFGVVSVEVEF